jgi:hypothetical protein
MPLRRASSGSPWLKRWHGGRNEQALHLPQLPGRRLRAQLQQALGDHGQGVWIDSRGLRGGDPLWPEIQKTIEEASAYAVVVSPASLQSKWVGKELRHALDVQKQRGKDRFRVIPLSLNNTKLGLLEEFFGEEPLYIPVSSDPGGIDAALNAILVALGKRLPADVPVAPQPKAEPLEELVLELTDLKTPSSQLSLITELGSLSPPTVRKCCASHRTLRTSFLPARTCPAGISSTSRTACAAPRLAPGLSMSLPRRGSVKLPVSGAGGSSRRSGRSRRRSCGGIWKDTPSGRASISGTARGRSRRTS